MRIIKTRLLPSGVDAVFLGVCIAVRPECANDEALIAHEMVHAGQFKRDRLFFVRYVLSKQYRFKCELEAYIEQVRLNPTALQRCAQALATMYGLDLRVSDCEYQINRGVAWIKEKRCTK